MNPQFSEELIDQLLESYENPEDLLGSEGILKALSKRLLERAMAGEITDHLGYEKHASEGRNSGNSRNGYSSKKVTGHFGETRVQVPRDRAGSYDPKILKKGQSRFDGFDEKIISLYARGLSTRDIKAHLEEIYGVDVSPTLISNVTNEILEDVKAWRNRPLEEVYPVVYFDAMRVKIRSEGRILNQAVYLGPAIDMEGRKQVLGMWVQENEGAKFWLSILTELQNRGVKDLFIARVDGLRGFPEAIQTVFPHTKVQLCIVHMVRNSLNLVSWKERKKVAGDLRKVYTAGTEELGRSNLDEFEARWGERYPLIGKRWRRDWEHLSAVFVYPPDIRRILYTTNPMESVNRGLRKVCKTRGVFPTEESVLKLFYLTIQNLSKKWKVAVQDWPATLNRFAIEFPDRFPL